ncbi:MAG TPA: FecR family protein [Thermoanaerobaculia bacterium]|nr:FecR family protein [Thermoanaerobaculia bacterium]
MQTPTFTTRGARPGRALVSVFTLLLALAAAAVAPPATAQTDPAAGGAYGYFRTIEGDATLIPAGDGERSAATPAEINRPVLPGDRIQVAERGRVEIVLPDRNLLRLDGGSEVVLDQLAGDTDGASGGSTRISLAEGNFQLVVVEDALGDALPRIDTPNASIYVQYPGTYRITSTADQGGWSSVVVRRGSVEVVTSRGSVRVRAGEESQIEGSTEGDRDARATIAQASGYDALERWGRDLTTRLADGGDLSRYGSWLDVDGHRYWRPTVSTDATGDSGWRPYTDGYWTSTPGGMSWVATEPWGWVPYHYGSWDFLPGYGWVWEPGTVFAASWVYWYWGPSYVGWCPIGFYTGWYGRRFHDPTFRFGVYGWAGGDWNHFAHWNFVGIGHFGHRDLHRWVRPAGDLRGDMRMRELPRGIVTTDTRGLTPGRWSHPDQVLEVLRHRGGPGNHGGKGDDLPDVTSFVARDPKLPPQVLRTVLADGPQSGSNRGHLAGTPLRPGTLGTRPQSPSNAGGIGGIGGIGGTRGRWTERTPPAGTGAGDRPALQSHAWDRQPTAPRTVPRPNPGDRTVRPPAHTWDRPTPATPTAPREGRPADRKRDRPARVDPGTPAPPTTPARPAVPRDLPANPAPPSHERPEHRQRQEPAPRPTPPPPAAPRPQPTPRPQPIPQPIPRPQPAPPPHATPPPAPRPAPLPPRTERPQPQRPPAKPPGR